MCRTLLPYLRNLSTDLTVHYNDKPLKTIESSFDRRKERGNALLELTPYAIRHTVACETRKRGATVCSSRFPGHSFGYRTTERYAKYGPDHLGAVVRTIDAFSADQGLVGAPRLDQFMRR